MTESYKYPEEMALQILSRMPPKTLIRFKCSCKSWYTLINSPSFVAKHVSNALHNKQSTCVFCRRYVFTDIAYRDVEISLITFTHDYSGDNDHGNISYSIQDIDLPLSMRAVLKTNLNKPGILIDVYIAGHYDGIICLVCNEIVLWNPAIQQYKVLPKPLLDMGPLSSIGFGYDARSKDYKVFGFPISRFDLLIQNGKREFILPSPVQVYNLSMDSWAEIDGSRLETETTNFCPKYFHMCFNGIWYWIGYEQQKEFIDLFDSNEEQYIRKVIIEYDTKNQVFEDILFPNSLIGMLPSNMRIIVWNESIALFGEYYSDNSFSSVDSLIGLWVMDDIVKGYWTKQFTLQRIVGTRMELDLWKSDEILMVANDNRIFSYNFRTEEILYLPIKSMRLTFSATVKCIKSIVPVI